MGVVNQTAYAFYTTYTWDYGILGVPVAGPPGTAMEAIAAEAPTCYKVVSWVAQAQDGGDPQPPDWDTGSANEVLAGKALSSTFLTDTGDGTTANTIAGVYWYLLLVPPNDTDQLMIGRPPYDASLQNLLYPATFIKGLLGPSGTPSGTGLFGGVQGNTGPSGLGPG